jgi:hypothetical protein
VEERIGKTYWARKALFVKGIRDKRLSVQEIERLLPPGSLSTSERWLLYYSLRAAEVELVDDETRRTTTGRSPPSGEAAAEP